MFSKILPFAAILLLPVLLHAQSTDTTQIVPLQEIIISGIKTVHGTGHMPEVKEGIVYAGKKNEVILTDSLDANKAINNTRQILGRIPGLNIVETENGGFTANGIATRGLNPNQSIEMNIRQNGYNISADVFGYNESYYIPPMEGVSRIEMVRGASTLQFGSQFGGMVNYVMKEAPLHKPFEFTTSQTVGNFGMFNAFNAIGGTKGKWSYYGFLQYRYMEGWRPNSQQTQVSGYGKVQYRPNEKWTAGVEYSLLRNRIRMPGGLTDSMFQADPATSSRARNWLKTPWNIVTGFITYKPTANTSIYLKTSYMFNNRSLVWRDEDGGAAALDIIDPQTGEYIPREVSIQDMHGTATEIRVLQEYATGRLHHTLAAGIRLSYSTFHRQTSGPGSTGLDFDLTTTGPFGNDLNYSTQNIAPFAENIFHFGERLTITPGIRFEYLFNTSAGYVTRGDKIIANEKSTRNIPLFGIGTEFKTSGNTNIYANISQAYRPITYSQLTPFGVTARIDPNLKDASGYNTDLGYRGTVKNYLNFDIGVFYLAYNQRIGVVLKTDPATGATYSLRTNVANSVHKGVEAYVEFNPIKLAFPAAKSGFSIFNSFAYTDAQYTTGEFDGNRVEAAPAYVNRTGLTAYTPQLSVSFQMSNVGDAYGDASNVRESTNPVAGYIPAYTVLDISATYKLKNYALKCGINNAGNASYFTRRANEYPGPGIIPSTMRSFYGGVTAVF
jgi:Fe(3+) dicitrate transport protein